MVAPRTLLSEGAIKVSKLKVAGHHHQPVPVRVSVAAELSEANRATANLACHLGVQGPPRREADERAGKVHMVNPLASQRVEHQLRLSKGRRNPQRKKERGLHRQGRNYLINFRGGSGAKTRSRFFS